MGRSILLVTMLLVNSIISQAQKKCPVNFDRKQLSSAQKDIDGWNGKIVAFNATVVEVKKGYKDKPYYKVSLDDNGQILNSLKTEEIWIGSLIKSGYEVAGRKLRILGYFAKIEKGDASFLKFNPTNYHILAFAIMDLKTKKMAMLPGAKPQTETWIHGNIPK